VVVAETETHPVQLTEITLPDGSTVKVNANSRIEYPEHFVGNIRKIKLSGEAFFDVTRDTLRPFIIETVHASVEVLGTSFNVTAYPLAGMVEVNVRTGRVKLTQNTEGALERKSTVLPAGERGWLKVADGEIGVANALAPNYSSWINKKLCFQHTPLSEAFSVLENTYHVKLSMEDPGIGTIPYTANFADQNLESIVEVIARTHHLEVKRVKDEIIFARIVN
jgi:ferric-dicitrate binding protein FerR (iron transport regulator)